MAIRPLTASQERMKNDPILKVGLSIRRRSIVLFGLNLICFFVAVAFSSPFIDFPIAAVMIISYMYSRKFRAWELKNKAYLESMGFCVN